MRRLNHILRFVAPWIVILALAGAVLSPGLRGGFLFDDDVNIVENAAIHIDTLSFASLHASLQGTAAGPLGRPISVLSFALTHYFFGLDPFAFKAINLAIHACNGLLLAWLVTLLLPLLRAAALPGRGTAWLACWVAAVWLVHPINILPIMLAVQRMTLLSGMFMLLALISHLKAMSAPPGPRMWAWYAGGWLVFWPLSVMSKETGFLFPLYVVTIMLVSGRGALVPGNDRKSWIVPGALVSLLVIGAAMFWRLGAGWLDLAYAMRPFTLIERLMTEGRVLWFYAAQILIPDYMSFGLYLDDFTLSTGLLRPLTTLLSLVAWGGVIVAMFVFRKRWPVLSFAAAWFLAGHMLESTFLPLEIAHEYRNYIPSIGLILGAGYLGARLLQKLRMDHPALTIGFAAATPLLVLALFTWLRAEQLGSGLIGSQMEATRHPASARANYTAALSLIRAGYGDSGDPASAQHIRFYFQHAEALDPSFKLGSHGLIIWACGSGRPVEKEWIDTFADRLQHTAFSPRDLELPHRMLEPLLRMPKCLSRQDALRLFIAGADNTRISKWLRARFLESASDYELLVSVNPASARIYLARAAAMYPQDTVLARKLKGYDRIK